MVTAAKREYFRELVRQDQKQKAKEQLQTLLLEGLNSGNATEMTAQDWEDIRQTVTFKILKTENNKYELILGLLNPT
ncbi:MAG: type II toxin-antitoxin system ParD family antitoxin [Cuspidothrix sp.]